MKKQFIRVLSLVLAMAMLLSLSACGGNTGTTGHVHAFSMWEIIEKPTSNANGMQMRRCTTCGFVEYSPIIMEGSGELKPTEPKPTEPTPTEPTPTEPQPTEPTPTEPQPTEPEPVEPVNPISPLGVVRKHAEVQSMAGVEAYGEYWFNGANQITADLSNNPALAYSLTIGDNTTFSSLPAGYDPEELLEWGKYPGLNMDILHKYGFTGKGAVIAYVDQPIAPHEQYAGENFHNTNNAKDSNNSMHGPAVLSLLAGKDIGTAPEAEVYFYGHSAWLCDQRTHAECLYQIIEQNKSLPEGQKITMVGFSDNIDPNEAYVEEFRAAVNACEEAGIMVWFCGEYGVASFLPMSSKDDYHNLIPEQWWGTANPQLVFIPSAGRTTAATMSGADYIYWSTGGLSWTMPYVLGLYAIAIEIDPSLTQDQLRELIVSSAYDYNGMRIVNPVGFVAAVLERVGRGAEGQAMLDEVSARQKYIYAIMDTAAMTQEDLQAVGSYLTTLTDATVLVVDAAAYASAEELYTALQADAAERGGQVVGVQIFGNVNMVPAFKVTYKVQMQNAVDEGGEFFTDLFYGNLNNDPAQIANGYNVMDHFAEGWDVDLVSQWPVARLPLGKGEFTAFFKKYNQFVLDSGMERLDLVNFSNPIFKQTVHSDDMSYFLNRMNKEFGMLDIPYRLYGSLVGEYPVTEKVLGGFTAENLSRENDAGIVEFIINTHGQWNNIDKCYYENGKEIRESLVNMDTINSVLDGNAYYLDCWACLNGYGMLNNLTTTALNGNCVGMFSATTIISNNGVNCRASLEDMHSSNFYYFYYCYLKALHEGASRSRAFQLAQQAYTLALLADGADGISWNANYQFNLYNVLAYHNFGVLEPNAGAMALTEGWGYIAQAGQSVPKEEIQETQQGGGGSMQNNLLLTDGKPVGTSVNIKYSGGDGLKTGTLEIHSFTTQALDNGYIRFSMEFTATKGMNIFVFNTPHADVVAYSGGITTGEKKTLVFDIPAETLQSVNEFAISFAYSDDDRTFIFFNTVGIS